jgi:NAD(P)-dependent dehydrogenase (short-subunit alcohol dehydrogenase family)
MDTLLAKQTTVMYGSGGAVGGAAIHAFAREGARVCLAGHTSGPLEALAREIAAAGGVAEAAQADAFDQLAVERRLSAVVEPSGSVDSSFNAISIGYLQGSPPIVESLEAFTQGVTHATKIQVLTTTAARRLLRTGSGVILAVTATPASLSPTSATSE